MGQITKKKKLYFEKKKKKKIEPLPRGTSPNSKERFWTLTLCILPFLAILLVRSLIIRIVNIRDFTRSTCSSSPEILSYLLSK